MREAGAYEISHKHEHQWDPPPLAAWPPSTDQSLPTDAGGTRRPHTEGTCRRHILLGRLDLGGRGGLWVPRRDSDEGGGTKLGRDEGGVTAKGQGTARLLSPLQESASRPCAAGTRADGRLRSRQMGVMGSVGNGSGLGRRLCPPSCHHSARSLDLSNGTWLQVKALVEVLVVPRDDAIPMVQMPAESPSPPPG